MKSSRIEGGCLEDYKKAQEECTNPEGYFITLVEKYLKTADKSELRALGISAYAYRNGRLHPDFCIWAPSASEMSDLFFRIISGGVR